MEKSTGDAWFNMKAPEITEELKGDLKVLKMRGSLDPKRFYKKNDRDGFPKYFQVGKKLRVSDTLNVHICFRKKDILDSFSSNNFPSRFCSLLFYVILTGTMLWLSYTLSEPFYVCVCETGWYSGGQPSRLLSFPCSQEGQEENYGGGAAGRCRVQAVSWNENKHNKWMCLEYLVWVPVKRLLTNNS